jgi:recombinational DNA repair protein RecR
MSNPTTLSSLSRDLPNGVDLEYAAQIILGHALKKGKQTI